MYTFNPQRYLLWFSFANFAWISGTDLIDLGDMKDWVDLEADSENCGSPKI